MARSPATKCHTPYLGGRGSSIHYMLRCPCSKVPYLRHYATWTQDVVGRLLCLRQYVTLTQDVVPRNTGHILDIVC